MVNKAVVNNASKVNLNPFPDTLLVPLKSIRGSTGPYDFSYSKPRDFYIEKIFVGPMGPFVGPMPMDPVSYLTLNIEFLCSKRCLFITYNDRIKL